MDKLERRSLRKTYYERTRRIPRKRPGAWVPGRKRREWLGGGKGCAKPQQPPRRRLPRFVYCPFGDEWFPMRFDGRCEPTTPPIRYNEPLKRVRDLYL